IVSRNLHRWIRALDDRVSRLVFDTRELNLLVQVLDGFVVLLALIISVTLLKLESFLYGLLTAAGIVGVAVGFAAKDIASNLISGLFLLVDRTFVVGDAVEIGAHAGTVQKVSLRTTTLATWDGPVVSIPNSILATSPVLNYSVAARRRVRLVFSIAAGQATGRAVEVLRETAQGDPRVLAEPTPSVLVSGVRDGSVELELVCYTVPSHWLQTVSDLRQAAVAALGQADLELAVPVLRNL
ncbi:MAG: mechanosensitive ion channel family protein, partial [Chloroflexi bacterium]|nr:mechanosensitive ion channel family protein [Chloroflexota bacterium]